MHLNLKIIIAVFLILMALGVVGYNVKFFVLDDEGAQPDENSFEMPATIEDCSFENVNLSDEEDGSSQVKPSGLHSMMLEKNNIHRNAPTEVENLDKVSDTISQNSAHENFSLGEEWKNTPWNKLVTAYIEKEMIQPRDKTSESTEVKVIEEKIQKAPPKKSCSKEEKEALKKCLESIRVKGIVVGKSSVSALINDYILHRGDYLPNMDLTILEIKKDHIRFRSEITGATLIKFIEPMGTEFPALQEKKKSVSEPSGVEEIPVAEPDTKAVDPDPK